jgi:hypothetical protein
MNVFWACRSPRMWGSTKGPRHCPQQPASASPERIRPPRACVPCRATGHAQQSAPVGCAGAGWSRRRRRPHHPRGSAASATATRAPYAPASLPGRASAPGPALGCACSAFQLGLSAPAALPASAASESVGPAPAAAASSAAPSASDSQSAGRAPVRQHCLTPLHPLLCACLTSAVRPRLGGAERRWRQPKAGAPSRGQGAPRSADVAGSCVAAGLCEGAAPAGAGASQGEHTMGALGASRRCRTAVGDCMVHRYPAGSRSCARPAAHARSR